MEKRKWSNIAAKETDLQKTGKSTYLRPKIKRGNISPDEEDLIIRLHKLLGNRWSLIAGRLPGRTDIEIKNYWNSVIRRKLMINGKQFKGKEAIVDTPQPHRIENLGEPKPSDEYQRVLSISSSEEKNSPNCTVGFKMDEILMSDISGPDFWKLCMHVGQ